MKSLQDLLRIARICALLLIAIAATLSRAENAAGQGGSKGDSKPNIMIVLVDDMGLMDTSVRFLIDQDGTPVEHPLNRWYKTPNMERLSKLGVRISEFYAMSVCSPSRISLMTGQNSARHRTTTWINPDANNRGPSGPPDWNWKGLDASSVTLARLMQQAGYRTIHVGKGHFGPRESLGSDPLNLGFDINVGGSSIGQPGSYYGTKSFGADGPKPTHAVPGLDAYHGQEIFLTEALTREAKKHVKACVEQGKPFFLNFCHYAVHAPFQSDPRFEVEDPTGKFPKQALAFASLVQGMDDSLGKMLDCFEELGIAENTLVFFLGDNGSDAPLGDPHAVASSAPLRGKKGSHYEGGMRVPFIAAWAKPAKNQWQDRLPIPSGQIRKGWGAIYDLFPTIAELVDLEIPSGHVVDGNSLKDTFASSEQLGKPFLEPREFLMHFPHAPHRSNYFSVFRQGDWKLIYHYLPEPSSPRMQLFDLSTDPYEQTDLAGTRPEERDKLLIRMREKLFDQRALYPVNQDGRAIEPTGKLDR
ncbi:MAG: sulfatase [Planctomycetota bacterium]|nr:sulfatase [Planctomycetota bacterium]